MNFLVDDGRSYVSRMYNLTESASDGGGDSFFAKPKNATIEPLNTGKLDGITAPVEIEPGVDDPLITPKGAGKSSGGPSVGKEKSGGEGSKDTSDKKPAEKSFGKSAKGEKDDDGEKKEPKDKESKEKGSEDSESKDKESKNPFQKSEKKDTDKEKPMKKESITLTFDTLYKQYLSEATGIDETEGFEDPGLEADPNALPEEEGDTETEDSTSVSARLRMIAAELNDLADEIGSDATGGEDGDSEGEFDAGDEFGEDEFKESVNCDGKLKPAKKSTLGLGSSQVVKGKLAGKRGGKAGIALKKRDATGNPVTAPKSKFGPKMSPVVKSRITGKNQELFQ